MLLQGPIGPFFRGLSRELQSRGDRVLQVVFNGGDEVFAAVAKPIPFRRGRDAWDGFLRALLSREAVTRIVLFGDCRPLHVAAIAICRSLGVEVWVFEEGYLRPWYLTLEQHGVNGHSRLPRDADAYADMPDRPLAPQGYRYAFTRRVIACMLYYTAVALWRPRYRAYRHHRRADMVHEAARWVASSVRKLRYRWQERAALAGLAPGSYFLVPLQVQGDTQVTVHSRFPSVAAFLVEIVASFARHADPTQTPVLKHHPMDRAYTAYHDLVAQLRQRFALGERLRYIHDQPLPALIHAARGVIGINSTAILSALQHGVPGKTCGEALFDLPGLTHQGSLAAFWQAPGVVDSALLERFIAQVVTRTQLNASTCSGTSSWDLLDRLPAFTAPQPVLAPVFEPVFEPVLEGSWKPESRPARTGELVLQSLAG